MPTQKQNLVTFALDLVKARTNDQPLLDPLFNTLDKVIRGVFSPTSKPSDSDIRLAVVNLYARILPFTRSPAAPAITLKSKSVQIWLSLKTNPRFDTSKTSVGLSKAVNKIMRNIKPDGLSLDAFILDLLRQTYGMETFQAALDGIIEPLDANNLTPTAPQLPL